MSKRRRAVDPALLPHPRPCRCTDCRRTYMRVYMASTTAPSVATPCPTCGQPARYGSRCSNCQTAQEIALLRSRSRRCLNCDSMFIGSPQQRHCSAVCRDAFKYTPVASVDRLCAWCCTVFTTTANSLAETCSRTCRYALDAHFKRWSNRDRCFLPQCRRCGEWGGFDPTRKQWCPSCTLDNHTAFRNANYALRKEVVAKGDKITIAELMRRHSSVCHLCGKKTRWGKGVLDPMYPTIDHLVPISKGGEHTWSNVALAHRRCNSSRGNKDLVDTDG